MTGYFETYRATVTPEQCDHLGHMNVQFYIAAISEGAITLISRLGLSPTEIQQRQVAVAAARIESDFMQEVREGEEIYLESAIGAIGKKSLTVMHRLKKAADDSLVMQSKVRAVMMNLDTRSSMELPADVRTAAEGLLLPPEPESAQSGA